VLEKSFAKTGIKLRQRESLLGGSGSAGQTAEFGLTLP